MSVVSCLYPGLSCDNVKSLKLNEDRITSCKGKRLSLADVESIPDNIGEMFPDMEVFNIDFSDNLKTLPDSIGLWTNLVHYNVDARTVSKITIFPNFYDTLETFVSRSNIETLPDGLKHCKNLSHIHVEGPSFSVVPGWISNFKNLTYFCVTKSLELKCMPSKSFTELSKLSEIDITECGLNEDNIIDMIKVTYEIPALKELNLTGNPGSTIPSKYGSPVNNPRVQSALYDALERRGSSIISLIGPYADERLIDLERVM